jgi:predicted transcriptional regulator
MAVISVRLNSEEEKILSYLSEYYDEEKSTIIKHSLKDLFEDIQDREVIRRFEESSQKTKFLSAEDILKEIV